MEYKVWRGRARDVPEEIGTGGEQVHREPLMPH